MHVEASSVRKLVPGLSIPPVYKCVYPQLECKRCCEVGVYPILSLGEGKYYKNAWKIIIGGTTIPSELFVHCCTMNNTIQKSGMLIAHYQVVNCQIRYITSMSIDPHVVLSAACMKIVTTQLCVYCPMKRK